MEGRIYRRAPRAAPSQVRPAPHHGAAAGRSRPARGPALTRRRLAVPCGSLMPRWGERCGGLLAARSQAAQLRRAAVRSADRKEGWSRGGREGWRRGADGLLAGGAYAAHRPAPPPPPALPPGHRRLPPPGTARPVPSWPRWCGRAVPQARCSGGALAVVLVYRAQAVPDFRLPSAFCSVAGVQSPLSC